MKVNSIEKINNIKNYKDIQELEIFHLTCFKSLDLSFLFNLKELKIFDTHISNLYLPIKLKKLIIRKSFIENSLLPSSLKYFETDNPHINQDFFENISHLDCLNYNMIKDQAKNNFKILDINVKLLKFNKLQDNKKTTIPDLPSNIEIFSFSDIKYYSLNKPDFFKYIVDNYPKTVLIIDYDNLGVFYDKKAKNIIFCFVNDNYNYDTSIYPENFILCKDNPDSNKFKERGVVLRLIDSLEKNWFLNL
jgi:hypothetical protein